MSRFLLLFAVFVGLAAPAWASETEHLRYHSLTRHMSAFEDVSPEERDKVHLTVRVEATKANGQPVMLWMEYAGKRYDLPVDEHGFVQVPRTPDIIAADPVIETNQPKGSLETKLALLLQVPDGKRFHYSDLRAATDQTDELIDKAAGPVSFFLPSIKGVGFTCPVGVDCALVVHHATGDEVLHADHEGKIRISLSPALDAENPLIEASIPLSDIEPLTD